MRALLVAPLHIATPGWGSREVGEHLGVSQSVVARAWNAAYGGGDSATMPRLSRYSLAIVGACVSPSNAIVVLAGRELRGNGDLRPSFMRSPRRPAIQTLLAADLLRATGTERDAHARHIQRDEAFLSSVVNGVVGAREVVVLSRSSVNGVAQSTVVPDAMAWQGLLRALVVASSPSSTATLLQLQLRLMEWARTGRSRFEWSDPTFGGFEHQSSRPPSPAASSVGKGIADQAFRLLLSRIASGQLTGGDRVTESSLARSLHTSRGFAREALRTLGAAGLVELEPNRGAIVPIPRAKDVMDTYSARRALGSLLVQRAAEEGRRDLQPADRALQHMLAIAETNDARATGDADLAFQDALAVATSMRHVPEMFRALTSQVLLYTTVMGLNYVYSIPHMCRDDIAIMRAVRARDAEEAVRVWQAKIDAALAHMAANL